MRKRLKRAFTLTESQRFPILMFTVLNAIAVADRENAPVWLWLLAVGIYPALAFTINFFYGE